MHESFRKLLKYTFPTLKESATPCRTDLQDAVKQRSRLAQEQLYNELQVNCCLLLLHGMPPTIIDITSQNAPGQISITFDSRAITSVDRYLTVTVPPTILVSLRHLLRPYSLNGKSNPGFSPVVQSQGTLSYMTCLQSWYP